MSLTATYSTSNAATLSRGVPASPFRERNAWDESGPASGTVYVIDQDLSTVSSAIGDSGIGSIVPGAQGLHRRMVISSTGTIEHFGASNVTALLARSIGSLEWPHQLLLKRPSSDGVHEKPTMFTVSDPFDAFVRALDVMRQCNATILPTALAHATRVLEAARSEGVLPAKVLPGGAAVFFYFAHGAKYAEIECDNEGDIGLLTSDRNGRPAVWSSDTDRLRADLARIRAFLV